MILYNDCRVEVPLVLSASEPPLDLFRSKYDFELFSFADNFSILILRLEIFHVFRLDLVRRILEPTDVFFCIIRNCQHLNCALVSPFFRLV